MKMQARVEINHLFYQAAGCTGTHRPWPFWAGYSAGGLQLLTLVLAWELQGEHSLLSYNL